MNMDVDSNFQFRFFGCFFWLVEIETFLKYVWKRFVKFRKEDAIMRLQVKVFTF